jgi:hypothetical protein
MVLIYTRVFAGARGSYTLFRSLRHKFDPLDREILERTFDATFAVVKGDECPVDFDSDEGLEAILRHELIEIACIAGVNDPETLRDLLLAVCRSDQHRRRDEASREGELRSNDLLLFVTDAIGT